MSLNDDAASFFFHRWVWADPYFNLITEVQILISHLLKTFGMHLGGELRVNPSRPLHLHNAAVGAEAVKAAEEAEVSTLILDTLLDANLERPLELNSTALDVLSTSAVRPRPHLLFPVSGALPQGSRVLIGSC